MNDTEQIFSKSSVLQFFTFVKLKQELIELLVYDH